MGIWSSDISSRRSGTGRLTDTIGYYPRMLTLLFERDAAAGKSIYEVESVVLLDDPLDVVLSELCGTLRLGLLLHRGLFFESIKGKGTKAITHILGGSCM